MTNIHKDVQKILSVDRAIQKNLNQGLINVRALARYLQDQGVSGSVDAIISAIRRFEADETQNITEEELLRYFNSMIINTKSNILILFVKIMLVKTFSKRILESLKVKKQ